MAVIQEIAVWTKEQPAWVSDAVRRLIAKGSLEPSDHADLAALIKSELGIEDEQQRQPVPLDASMLPAEAQPGADVCLIAIREPQHLNAIGSTHAVTFEPDGLTIVYGYNGAGKSGYARALKKACRARDSEGIIPNVYSPPAQASPAQARFEWRAGQAHHAAVWTDGSVSPDPLSRIAVFDAHCARVFVDDQAEVSYAPYGMGILRELAAGLQAVQGILDAELRHVKFDMTKLSSLAGDHAVGKLIRSLSRTTDPKAAEQLAALSAQEQEELTVLQKLFRDDDPARQAVALRRFAVRIQALETELTQLEGPLLEEHIGKLRLAFEQLVAAENASKLAATALQEGGKALPGTGTEPWEILVRSAMAFAHEHAYLGHPFPGPADGASCVLCQQPLSHEASARLTGFVRFLEADAQRTFAEKRRIAGDLYRAISNVNCDSFPSDKTLLDELTEQAPETIAAVRAFVAALKSRQAQIKGMAPRRRLDDLEPLPPAPSADLKALRDSRLGQAEKLEKAMTPEVRQQRLALLADLEARSKLAPLVPTVLEAITAFRHEHALLEAARRCNTAFVTRKLNELYEMYVTSELRTALERELKELGLSSVKVGLEMSGQRGARMQRLKLAASDRFTRLKLSNILSEGEQRAIALASFLAEISIEPTRSGIVFDDPVSSLDHVRRDHIANRLALEARHRQVVVFTHDLAFAWSLRELAERHGARHVERHVYAAGESKGHCADALPFEAKKLDGRVSELRVLAARAKKALEQEHDHAAYNDMVRNGYRRMRDTWELVIEDLLFAGTVKRFRRSIETRRLRFVAVEDADVRAVFDGMTRCSNFTHEGGAEAPPALPSPDEFLTDVDSLGDAVVTIKAREAATEQRRLAAGIQA